MHNKTNSDREPLLGNDAHDRRRQSDVENFTTSTNAQKSRHSKLLSRLAALIVTMTFAVILIFLILIPHNGGDGLPMPTLPTELPKPSYPYRNPAYLERGRTGGVASEEPTCSQIGLNVLKEGGTATDAAIASLLCVGTLNMFSSGIGGGGFGVIRPPQKNLKQMSWGNMDAYFQTKDLAHGHGHASASALHQKQTLAIDYRETAPAGSYPNMFTDSNDPNASQIGGLSVGVPGELKGFEAAYKIYGGGVSWKRLFEPSINLARNGWNVTDELDRRLQYFGSFMLDKPEWKEIFAPNGKLLRKGQLIKRPAYATTLEKIAKGGADVFYKGEIPELLSKAAKAEGGIITPKDFENYTVKVEPAIESSYNGKTIYTTHAPSGGPVFLNLMNTLEPLKLKDVGRTTLNVHRFIEALKIAFAHRTHIGDPDFVDIQDYLDVLITKDYGQKSMKNITDDRTHTLNYYNPVFDIKEDHGTTHVSVIDKDGGAASLTSTVNLIFGSHVMDPVTGIILNDEMNDFAEPNVPDAFGLRPSPYNYPRPGARPLSSTSASILDDENGLVHMAIGGSGGSRIFPSVAQVLLNLDWGYDLSHAIEEPRVHDQLLPAEVQIESGFPPDIIKGLEDKGHNTTLFDINIGIAEVHAVLWDRSAGWLYASSDSRKNSRAAAY